MSTQTQDDMLVGTASRAGFGFDGDSPDRFLAAVAREFPSVTDKDHFFLYSEKTRESLINYMKTWQIASA